MAYCREQAAVKRTETGEVVVSLPCRAWTCPDCQPVRKRRLTAEGIGGQPTAFLTLTFRRRPGMTPEQAAKALSRAWRLLRLRIMRRWTKGSLPFLCVFERHLSGWPHLHILARMPFVPQRWLSLQMHHLAGSRIVSIERINNARKAAAYCAKYCSKCVQKIGTAKRYWQSQDYDQRPPFEHSEKGAPGYGWQIEFKGLYHRIGLAEQLGWTVEMVSPHKAVITYLPWENSS